MQISIKDLRNLLHKEEVNFEYEKKDGTVRKAVGTLKEETIPKDQQPKGDSDFGSNLKYFDLEKNAWRSISYDVSTIKII